MDYAVYQCLAHGIMSGCFFLPFIAYQLEWLGQGLDEFVVHSYIELEQVGLPGTVGIDAVGPTYPGVISEQPFLIIHKVIRLSGGIGYHVGLAEHQKSGTGDAVFACRYVVGVCANFLHELQVVRDLCPRMGGVQVSEQLAVLVQGEQVDGVFKGEPFSNDGILRVAFMFCIGK